MSAVEPGLGIPVGDSASEVFRETFLLWVTEPELNRALRVLGKALYGMVLEHSRHWPRLPGSMDCWDLRAAVGDLRHVQCVLERIRREPADEPPNDRRTADGTPLIYLAEHEATAIAEIADELERDLADVQPAKAEP